MLKIKGLYAITKSNIIRRRRSAFINVILLTLLFLSFFLTLSFQSALEDYMQANMIQSLSLRLGSNSNYPESLKNALGAVGLPTGFSKVIFGFGSFLTIVLMITCVINLTVSIRSSVSSRTEEISLLKSIGYQKRSICVIIILETLIASATAMIISLVLSTTVMAILNRFLFQYELIMSLGVFSFLSAVGIALLIVPISSVSAMCKAIRIPPIIYIKD